LRSLAGLFFFLGSYQALKGLGGFLFAKVGLDVAVCKLVQRKYQWQRMVGIGILRGWGLLILLDLFP
jgi:hypothetical protein